MSSGNPSSNSPTYSSDNSKYSPASTLRNPIYSVSSDGTVMDDDEIFWDEKYQLPPIEKPITSPKAQKVWVRINSVVDFFFVKTFLKPCGLDTKEKREAWREKIRYFRAMVFLVLLMIALLFVVPFFICKQSSGAEKGIITIKTPYCMFLDVVYIIFMVCAVGVMVLNVLAAIIVQRSGKIYRSPLAPEVKPKKLLALHIPCYSESKEVILKTVNSVVQSDYDDESKLLFVVADGNVTGSGNDKSTPRILIEDIFKCTGQAEPLMYQSVGHGDQRLNKACVYTGYYSPDDEPERKIKYLLVVKVGLETEKGAAKPGNRSKRDSQLIVYNFFREANGFFLDDVLQKIETEEQNPFMNTAYEFDSANGSVNAEIARTSAYIQDLSLWGTGPGNGYSVTSLSSSAYDSTPGTPTRMHSSMSINGSYFKRKKTRFSCPMFAEMYSSLKFINCNAKDVEYVLVADADTFIRPNGLDILVHALEADPNLSGVCGETKVENRTQSYITMIQVFEYFLTHCLLKSFESFYANVLVLSGCFTVYRLKRHIKDPETGRIVVKPAVLDPRIMRDYMAEPKLMREHNLLTIGEDRYLCTLVIRYLNDMRTRYIPTAVCTTTVPDTLSVLLCQRRRWTNSLIHNHFDLFMNPPKFPSLRMRLCMKLVMLSELWSAAAIPFFLPFGFVIAIYGFWTHLTWLSLAFTLVLFCLPGLIAFMAGRYSQVGWWLVFLLGLPLWAVVVPLYSLWKMDDFSWGSTRPTNGPAMDEKGGATGDFVSVEIPEPAYQSRDTSISTNSSNTTSRGNSTEVPPAPGRLPPPNNSRV
ncbi:hypothetical protein K493DRAFT_316151 [Basidiobolus meristosporus CBS 931.73]|uniref:chitin synthase n=1 Tax=Basidiobolus meristosporus CBS 931.73 TaxID=1314790 RepID=A0A1Y1Y572_9FUNG|nr:hypothetical protein K493DRAFT_316151 [Basidiobolus meristosporus CBS 931.73]|eukprot:ORX93162.1 hypothetical protein K493DRAFT_316151 [Basidiobolus meristosporus CBS 931.73]